MSAARLLDDATAAVVDRAPIDWAALLSRAARSPDRALFEGLRGVAAVRDAGRATRADRSAARTAAAAWLIVAVASIETLLALTLVAMAAIAGESLANRTPQVILALTFAAGSLTLAAASRDARSLFLLATLAASAGVFARSATSGLPPAWAGPFGHSLRGVLVEAFIPACLWQFAHDVPQVVRFARFDTLARRAAAACWWLGAALVLVNIAAAAGVDVGALAYLLRDHPGRLFWRLFSAASAPAVAAVFVRSRRAPAAERRKIRRLALAIAGGIGPFALLSVARIGVPAVDAWFRAGASASSALAYGAIVAALAATPIATAVAIVADRPFDRQRALRRGGVWTLVTRASAERERARLGRAIDRIARARGARETFAALCAEAPRSVDATTARALVRGPLGAFAEWSNGPLRLPAGSALVALLQDAVEPLDVSPDGPLLGLLPRRDREWIADANVHVLTAVTRRSGDLVAFLACGPARSGAPFDRGDRALLQTLAAAAGAACDADPNTAGDGDEAAFECPACGLVAAAHPLPCGCSPTPTLAALPRSLAGKFIVRRRLGAGGMGIVYLARDAMLNRDVALKTLPALGAAAVHRLRAEGRAMAALDHEALATVYGVERWRGTPVLVMEYFPNGTLAQLLARRALSPAETVAMGSRLARALEYMHARGIAHRDVKASNIGIDAGGRARLLDFGLAGAPTSRDADVRALARVLLEALCGVNASGAACRDRLAAAPALRFLLERALVPAADGVRTAAEFRVELDRLAAAIGG
jgi:protein kinase-like protein